MSLRELIILGCSSQQPTRLRNHGAYLLRCNQEGLLFDPGEGTQRQFIFADIAPTCITRIFVSHFHGDHCLGLSSILIRLNLDKVTHPIHCYYPASGKTYFDRLRYSTHYHDHINLIEHPIMESGIVHADASFIIEAQFLDHTIDNLGWRIKEADTIKFYKEKLLSSGVQGKMVRELKKRGMITIDGKTVQLKDVSYVHEGSVFSVVIDTKYCKNAVTLAKGAKLFLCESTYLEEHRDLAINYAHMTAKQAAHIAKEAGVTKLILTHFSARYRNLRLFEEEAQTLFYNVEVADDLKRFSFPK